VRNTSVSTPDVALRDVDGTGARILVVDDEAVLADLLMDALRFTGFEVNLARSGQQALRAVAEFVPDLLVLDVNLPDLDGFEVCARLRQAGNRLPVIFLTARDDPDDLRTGFVRGGDDYLTKPFSLEELTLRIAAVLRRSLAATGGAEPAPTARLCHTDLVMDLDAHRVWRAGEPVTLSPTEFRLLHYLLLNRNRVLSKEQILRRVWRYDFAGDTSVVETYVFYLRRKIDTTEPRLIHTVRGVGYVLRRPDE
jgi:two-component system OmpR family response regulator